MNDMLAISSLHRLATHSVGVEELDSILQEILDVAIEFSGADLGNIQLFDSTTADLRIKAQRGFSREWIDFWDGCASGQGACGSAVEARTRVIVEDVATSPLFAGKPALDVQLKAGVRAVQSTPLLTRSGKAVGVISTHFRVPHRSDERTLRWLDLLGRQAADLIDNHQMTSALRGSESRYRAMVNATSDVIYSMSPDWSCMRFLEGKGFISDTRDASDDWVSRYIDAEDRPQVLEAIRKAIETKSVFEFEHRVRRADGSLGWTHSRAVPIFNDAGEIAEWFGTASDVTESRQAEARLLDERQRLEALLQALPVGVAFTDSPDCRDVTGNSVLLRQFDAGAHDNVSASAADAQALGRQVVYLRDDKLVAPEELPLQQAAREGRTIEPHELLVRLPSGREFWAEVCGAPIRNTDGDVVGAVTVTMDITDRKRVREAQEQTRLKDEFLAMLGHELRNPLAAISNAVELLKRKGDTPHREATDELIRSQVGVLKRLVDDLLDISRFALGNMQLRKGPVSLFELLNTAVSAAQPIATQRFQQLVVEAPDADVHFLADQVRLQQILANLLDNACKYSRPNGRVELSGALEGSDIVLRCKDHGRGVAPEMQDRIFEPMMRLDPARKDAPGGLGLGLALVRRLARLHEGDVSLNSRGDGTGCEFVVRIPFEAAAEFAPLATPLPNPAVTRRSLSVAIVEDNPDVAQILALALERAGHRVNRFADGKAALTGTEDFAPDVVLLDSGLPGLSGYEVLARLRERPHFCRTRFIGISGRAAPAGAGVDGGGFDDFLLKPIDIKALLSLIEAPSQRASAPSDTQQSGQRMRWQMQEPSPDADFLKAAASTPQPGDKAERH